MQACDDDFIGLNLQFQQSGQKVLIIIKQNINLATYLSSASGYSKNYYHP